MASDSVNFDLFIFKTFPSAILQRELHEFANEANKTEKIREIRPFAAFAFEELFLFLLPVSDRVDRKRQQVGKSFRALRAGNRNDLIVGL